MRCNSRLAAGVWVLSQVSYCPSSNPSSRCSFICMEYCGQASFLLKGSLFAVSPALSVSPETKCSLLSLGTTAAERAAHQRAGRTFRKLRETSKPHILQQQGTCQEGKLRGLRTLQVSVAASPVIGTVAIRTWAPPRAAPVRKHRSLYSKNLG